MSLLSFFQPITNLLDELITSDEERGKIQIELNKLQSSVDKEFIKLTGKSIDAETKIREADYRLREAELKSDSKLVKNWRPFLMIILSLPMIFNWVIYPMMLQFTDVYSIAEIELPEQYWSFMQLFYGVYGGGRTIEKVAKHIYKEKR